MSPDQVEVAQTIGFCLFLVFVIKFRPWRWVLPFFSRAGRS